MVLRASRVRFPRTTTAGRKTREHRKGAPLRVGPFCSSCFRTAILLFVDSKGHSRFVLRILIILSHRSANRESPGLLFERVVATVNSNGELTVATLEIRTPPVFLSH